MKFNYILKKDDINELKKQNEGYIVTDEKADIIPIPQNNIVYEMPAK